MMWYGCVAGGVVVCGVWGGRERGRGEREREREREKGGERKSVKAGIVELLFDQTAPIRGNTCM